MSRTSTLTSGKGQSGVETALLFSFMIIILTVFLLAMGNQYINIQESKAREKLDQVAELIEVELKQGAAAQNGYERTFEVPLRAGGLTYNVSFYNTSMVGSTANPANFTEVIIGFYNTSLRFETFLFLPPNIEGRLQQGHLTLRKSDGVLYMEPVQ